MKTEDSDYLRTVKALRRADLPDTALLVVSEDGGLYELDEAGGCRRALELELTDFFQVAEAISDWRKATIDEDPTEIFVLVDHDA